MTTGLLKVNSIDENYFKLSDRLIVVSGSDELFYRIPYHKISTSKLFTLRLDICKQNYSFSYRYLTLFNTLCLLINRRTLVRVMLLSQLLVILWVRTVLWVSTRVVSSLTPSSQVHILYEKHFKSLLSYCQIEWAVYPSTKADEMSDSMIRRHCACPIHHITTQNVCLTTTDDWVE